jgi:hypothetical protein
MADTGPLLCVMTVDIGDGRNGTVNIHMNDSEEALALKFISEYGLPEDVVETLAEHIRTNKSIAVERALTGDSAQIEATTADTETLKVDETVEARPFEPEHESAIATGNSPELDNEGCESPPVGGADLLVHTPNDEALSPDHEAQYEALHAQYAALKSRNSHRLSSGGLRRNSASSRASGLSGPAGVPQSFRSRHSVTSAQQLRPQARTARLIDLAKPRAQPAVVATGGMRGGASSRRVGPPLIPSQPAPLLHADRHSDPALFDRLHHEATERDARRMELEKQRNARVKQEWQQERERRRAEMPDRPATDLGVLGNDDGSMSPSSRVGHRLHEAGHVAKVRLRESAVFVLNGGGGDGAGYD